MGSHEIGHPDETPLLLLIWPAACFRMSGLIYSREGREVTTLMRGLMSGWRETNPITDVRTIGLMESLDGFGYITTGFSFLIIGMVVFVHSWYVFMISVGSMVVQSVLAVAKPKLTYRHGKG